MSPYAHIPEDATEVPRMALDAGYTYPPFALPTNDWDAPPTKLTAGVIATKAASLVSGDRDRQHGAKRDNFQRIALLWNAYMKARRIDNELDAVDVGHMMALMKIARTQSGALNVDDYVDGAGYLACAGEIAAERNPTTSRVAS